MAYLGPNPGSAEPGIASCSDNLGIRPPRPRLSTIAREVALGSFLSFLSDRSFGWYDILGTNPYNTTGTFAYARPNGDQVSLTYRADEDSDGVDCLFEGTALRQINQTGPEVLGHLELYGGTP